MYYLQKSKQLVVPNHPRPHSMGTGVRFRHSCDRQGRRTQHGKTRRRRTPARQRHRSSAPLGPSLHTQKILLGTTQERGWEGGGRLPGAPGLEEGRGREAPSVPTVPLLGQGAVGCPQAGKARGSQCPQPRARRGTAHSRRHPLIARHKLTEKRHASSLSGVSAGLRGKRPFTSPSVPGNQANTPGSHQEELLVGPRGVSPPGPAEKSGRCSDPRPAQGSAGGELSFHPNQAP